MKNFFLFKRIIFLLFLFIIYFFILAFSYTNTVCSNISKNIFRLHVIANSNTPEDQNLKYIVRDNILEYINKINFNSSTKYQATQNILNNINNIKKIAQQTVYDNGYNYNVSVEIGNYAFPLKTYNNITLPKGNYDALRIKIGSAEGKNWWCVMFPPLCLVDVTTGILPDSSMELLNENLSSEEYNLLTNQNYSIKFKIVELIQSFNINN